MMQRRPSIPAEIVRLVLVEAGHRCAIHTCRHPAVDIHHIDPWSQVRRHSYENLIALCPNCHRRADRGEIDRLSLRMYKARLGSGEAKRYVEAEAGGAAFEYSWEVAILKEARDQPPHYEAELEYPRFLSPAGDIVEINDLERAAAIGRLQEFREGQLRDIDIASGDAISQFGSLMSSSFDVLCATPDIISIRQNVFHFGSGAAHPNHWTVVSNYQLNPVCRVQLRDLFSNDSFAAELSRHCISDLVAQRAFETATDDILNGAGPTEKNFTRFNVSPEGLVVNFDEYTVGSYAEGAFTVVIPRYALAGILRPNAPITRYLLRDIG
jgi:hypothetical protein